MLCFKSNKTLYDCDATVLLNVYSYLVFVGKGWLALVQSHLPHLIVLSLDFCMWCDRALEIFRASIQIKPC
jgi:hypothetical protein